MIANINVINENNNLDFELPLVPLIDKNFRECDRDYSLGKISQCEIGEYLKSTDNFGHEVVFIKNYDDPEDVLSAVFGWEMFLNLSDAEIESKYNNLPWYRGILMHIAA